MAHFDESELENIKPGPIAWMASNPIAANLAMIVMLVGGFLLLLGAKQEIFPQFTMDIVNVSMTYPGASPEEVEQGILLAIEDAVKDVDGIDEISSSAHEGYGRVFVEIQDEDDAIRITQDIKTAVDQITTFPVDAENLTVSLLQGDDVILDMVLHGSVSQNVLRDTAERVRTKLENHDDITIVDFKNIRNYEIHIEISQETLRRYVISIPEVASILSQTSIELGGGSLKTASGQILVRMTERRNYANEFGSIPIIKNANGSTVTLSDIATISDTFEDKDIYDTFNSKPAIEMQINGTSTQSPIEVFSAVNEVIDELNATFPGDLQLTITNNRSKLFKQRAELLIKNGVLGLILVIIFLALFLDIRLALWVSMGIPISYMGAFLLFPAADYFSINMISMFAFIIALGIVVDDAIVVGENIYHKRQSGMKPLAASVTGAREMFIPVSVSILTNMIAFMPMFFMPGFMGKIFSIIPVIVISTFMISWFESLFILPSHLTFKQSKEIKNKFFGAIVKGQKAFNRKFDSFIENMYIPFLKRTVSLRYISLSAFLFVLIVVGSYVVSGRLGIQMFPRVESDFSHVSATLEVGAPEAKVKSVENKLVQSALAIIEENGAEQLSFGVHSQVNENVITMRAYLTDPDTRTISTKKLTDLWRQRAGNIPGLESLTFSSDFGGPGHGAALTVELSHEDTAILDQAAIKLAQALEEYPNTQDIDDGTAQGKRQFDFTVTDLGYTLGFTPANIGRQIRSFYYGSEAVKQQRGRNEVRAIVMLPKEERESFYHFTNMMIKAPNGSFAMLSDVVKAKEGRAYTTINRRNSQRVSTVESDVTPPSEANLIIADMKTDILPELQKLYPGLSYSFEGQQADMRESLQSLFVGMFGILFIMYAILAVLFSSYTQPLMIMIAIPFSIVGAIIGHFIMGFSMSIVSMFGIIALAGVVINDSLILIDMANKKRKECNLSNFDAVVIAARQRFRPIILTTLTTFVGLAPMMFETSRQARFLVPMAISLGYGILFATFLTLILIPSLYMINEDIKRLFKRFIELLLPYKPKEIA